MKNNPYVFTVKFPDLIGPPSKLRGISGANRTVRTPIKTRRYEALIRDIAIKAMLHPFEKCPVSIAIFEVFKVPNSYSKKRRANCLAGLERPIKIPDFDNVCKLVCDAVSFKRQTRSRPQIPGIAYRDDAQIVRAVVEKWFGEECLITVAIKQTDIVPMDIMNVINLL